LKGSLKTKIEENSEQIRFSKFLATIKTNVPIEMTEDDFIRKEMDESAIKELFEELQFRTLLTRVLKQEPVKIITKGPVQGDLFTMTEQTGKSDSSELPTDIPALPTDLSDIHTTPHLYTMFKPTMR